MKHFVKEVSRGQGANCSILDMLIPYYCQKQLNFSTGGNTNTKK